MYKININDMVMKKYLKDNMLKAIAERCTDVLLKHEVIQESRKAIYIYGFELLWSLVFSSISILILGFIFHYVPLAFTFLIYFIPIRIPAGGFHADSYENCFLITNLTAVICVFISKWLYNSVWAEYVLWGALTVAVGYIWLEAPAISRKNPVTKSRIVINRKYARLLLTVDLIGIIFMKVVMNSQIISTAIVTLCTVAVMIFIAKKGGKIRWMRYWR